MEFKNNKIQALNEYNIIIVFFLNINFVKNLKLIITWSKNFIT